MKRKLGCLSGYGIFASLGTLLIIGMYSLMNGNTLFSPGGLNAISGQEPLGGYFSHAEVSECASCHPSFWERDTMADRCLQCHTAIADQIEENTGLHAAFEVPDIMACRQCHTEHKGPVGAVTYLYPRPFPHESLGFSTKAHTFRPDGEPFICEDCHTGELNSFDLQVCETCHRELDPEFITSHTTLFGESCLACHDGVDHYGSNFDHSTLAFPLDGKHAQLECATCHTDARSSQDLKDTAATCYSCHAEDDNHNGQFGEDCGACHDSNQWEGAEFDHSRTEFPLTGAHLEVSCKSCHTHKTFKEAAQDCYGCHQIQDEHEGRYGTDCAYCHTPEGWNLADFDHALTGFPLTGQHAATACLDCHVDGVFENMQQTCFACHQKDDPHDLQFGEDCTVCHTTDRWSSIIFDHSSTAFPLTGRHETASCLSCHANQLKGLPANCYSCHQKDDKHAGQFGTDCTLCHSTESWGRIIFNHASTAFPLTGAHQSVSCQSCHQNGRFRGTPTNCVACHQKDDAHQGQFGTDCTACHTTSGWKPSTFDHSRSAFPLTGAHQSVSCQNCHQNGRFRGTPTNCVACHQKDDAHQGQFGTDCTACHTTSGWKPSTFDHSRSAFPLTGAHQSVSCQSCHQNGRFRGTPTNCVACHQNDDAHQGQLGTDCAACHTASGWTPATFDHSRSAFPLTGAHQSVACLTCHVNGKFQGTPATCSACHSEPAFHSGMFGTDCAACHTTSTWIPADYNRAHQFPLRHGDGGSNECRLCHPSSLDSYTCYGCHEHRPDKIEKKHLEKGIINFQDCMSCHPDGREPDDD